MQAPVVDNVFIVDVRRTAGAARVSQQRRCSARGDYGARATAAGGLDRSRSRTWRSGVAAIARAVTHFAVGR